MTKRYLLALFCFCLLAACAEKEVEDLPNTPETVVRAYQKYLDKNNFRAAKKLSTKAERDRLDMIQHMIEDEPSDSTITDTNFLTMTCKERGKNAVCYYTIEGFDFDDSIQLVNQRGQWLVDVTEEEFTIESDTLFEEIIRMMDEGDILIEQ